MRLRKQQHTPPLEFFALRWSSYVLSVFVLLYGLSFVWPKRVFSDGVILIIAGLVGIIATARINNLRDTEKERIDKSAGQVSIGQITDDGENGETNNCAGNGRPFKI